VTNEVCQGSISLLLEDRETSTILMQKVTSSATQADVASLAAGITVDKSVEFTYQELFNATEGFNITHKIGQGGFGAVYYAELVGEKAAIKKMDMQATQEFLAELKVLTHVHHLNLVRLIGYCTESSLFLVYEFVENGNLSQHLRGTDYEPLSWAERVRIALDSARGLEYIHEHTVPVYIHRDIKSANILIDKNTRAKVADFGLTKLTEVGGASLQTRVVGTFGYMPPEYVRYGDISRKVDVYAFGVVLYELISGKDAIVRPTDGSASGSRGLVYLFEEALTALDPKEGLQKLIDPKLGDDYPVDAILMMTHLANACTEEDPKLRPTMRSVVVALMTLSSMSEFWDMKNPGLVNLMSGR
uniref:non-specific serine/threonine protein kinase n=1 Tax=Aegilops tauschii subsp. strangulata TaxID=200361 RepID=A0A453Q7S8_AEGTS